MSGTGNQEFQSLKTLKTLKMILGTYWTTFHVYVKKSLFIGEYDNAFCHCGLPFLELTGCGNDDQLVNKKSAVWAIVPFMSSMFSILRLRENEWESEKVRVVETDSGRECAEVESVRVTFEYRWDRYSISIWKSEDFTLYRGQMPLLLEERVGYDYRKNDNRTGIKMKVVQNVMRMSDSQYVPNCLFPSYFCSFVTQFYCCSF